jgi:peroxiredoxin
MGTPPLWLKRFFLAAGIYNIAAGGGLLFSPHLFLRWINHHADEHVFVFQLLGGGIILLGGGYLIASSNPYKHWPIILIGFLSKLLVPFVFLFDSIRLIEFSGAGYIMIFDDLIWILPFAVSLYETYRLVTRNEEWALQADEEMLDNMYTSSGESISALSYRSPVLVVFLRHTGCPFCREALSVINENKQRIEQRGTRIVLVTMNEPASLEPLLQQNNLRDVDYVADTDRMWYRMFGLKRGSLSQIAGLSLWWKFFSVVVLKRHGVGWTEADAFQLPGAFLVHKGRIVRQHFAMHAADHPDFVELSRA